MNDDNEVKIPIHIGGGQYGIVKLSLTTEVADHLEDKQVISVLKNNTDLDMLSYRLRELATND